MKIIFQDFLEMSSVFSISSVQYGKGGDYYEVSLQLFSVESVHRFSDLRTDMLESD